ncbi:hypothetical protein AAC387_Pa04g1920 [Persea americana]
MKNVQMKSVMEMVIGAIKCCQVTGYNATIVKVMRKGIMSQAAARDGHAPGTLQSLVEKYPHMYKMRHSGDNAGNVTTYLDSFTLLADAQSFIPRVLKGNQNTRHPNRIFLVGGQHQKVIAKAKDNNLSIPMLG